MAFQNFYYINFYQDADGATYRGHPFATFGAAERERRNVLQGFPNDRAAYMLRIRFKQEA